MSGQKLLGFGFSARFRADAPLRNGLVWISSLQSKKDSDLLQHTKKASDNRLNGLSHPYMTTGKSFDWNETFVDK